ncbi:hypothetical protein B7494_g7777 [Chlorociboria aeruginascens]|nr:hypothetical protein B7494_g7777 [Chlorociboria aeruginascens]
MPENGKKSKAELHKRRGIYLPPIITNLVFKAEAPEPDNNPEPEETLPYEETLKRYRDFFNNRPLMRCLDTNKDQLPSETLYEKLLEEVKQGLDNTRGQLQVRAFWDDVRLKLRIDTDDEINEPEEDQESTHQGTHAIVTS